MTSEIIPVKAAGGVLYKTDSSRKKVLLIKRKGFWDLPKGKLEEGESIRECAIREVEEEVGAKNLSIEHFLCNTYHEYKSGEKKYGKTTSWFLMKHEAHGFEFSPQAEEGITELKWVEIKKAKSMVAFENLVKVLKKMG